MKIEIREQPFNPYREIENYQASLTHAGKYGATACFVGTMRDFNEGRQVHGMTLEYYPGMTEKHIAQICETAMEKWSLLDCLAIHRVGRININDTIVAVAAWAGHRGDALEACRFIIEDLKSRAPFWKKEKLDNGEAWVEKNTSGYNSKN
jgi:molybdopterin synthase catalytic subunit